MARTERDDVDWATAAEQSSEEDEAQEGSPNERDEDADGLSNFDETHGPLGQASWWASQYGSTEWVTAASSPTLTYSMSTSRRRLMPFERVAMRRSSTRSPRGSAV